VELHYVFIGCIAFICETIDSSLGGGYGTILTPVLLFMGFEPLDIVPLILVSELITGLTAGISHHRMGNVDLRPGAKPFKIALVLSLCGIMGAVIAVFSALNLPKTVIKGYIAFLIMFLGVFNLLALEMSFKFSWKKIMGLGMLASFNKALSGGGYGPLIVGGQLLSGLKAKNAVGITSLAEGLTCLVGIVVYLLMNGTGLFFNWHLGLALTAGALLSVPFSVNLVRLVDEKLLRRGIAVTILILGFATFYKTFHALFCIHNLPLAVFFVIIALPLGYFLGKKKTAQVHSEQRDVKS